MKWFQLLSKQTSRVPERIETTLSENASDTEKLRRVYLLAPDEQQVFRYLRQGFSPRWIAETVCISRTHLSFLERKIYRTLGVANSRALILLYGKLELTPAERPD